MSALLEKRVAVATMNSVNVKRTDLLEKLKVNRAKHKEDYDLALEGYKIEIRQQVSHLFDRVTRGDYDNKGVTFHEVFPQHHLAEYDQVIAMMEMSVDDIITMTSNEVSAYVLDNWAWKQSFTATTAKYVSNALAKM